jgi:hypothetical protein
MAKDPIEVEYVALVSPEDPRCKAIGKTNKNFLKFLRLGCAFFSEMREQKKKARESLLA